MRAIRIQKIITDQIYNEKSAYPYGVINIYDNASSSVWNNVSFPIQQAVQACRALKAEFRK